MDFEQISIIKKENFCLQDCAYLKIGWNILTVQQIQNLVSDKCLSDSVIFQL